MNELYGNNQQPPRRSGRRRLLYIIAVLLVLFTVVKVAMPPAQTVRLSLVINQESPVEMTLTVPKGCVLDKVYLAATEKVPRQGDLFTLKINEHSYNITDFETLVKIKTDDTSDTTDTRITRVDWNVFKGVKTFAVSYSNVNKTLTQYDLELVFEVTGDPAVVKRWNEFVQLKALEPSKK